METRINAKGLHYKDLNDKINDALNAGYKRIILDGVNGQRYIGAGVKSDAELVVNGTPGNDMAAFADGLRIVVNGNAQDAVGNTMNNGELVIHGNTADILGYAMRQGHIFVKGNVGYRVGIHMKAYHEIKPVLVIGGTAGDFFGEYMAGGDLILLGLGVEPGKTAMGDYVGTGMHGGAIYIRGEVDPYNLGKEVKVVEPADEDLIYLRGLVEKFCGYFGGNPDEIMQVPFKKLIPYNSRPYGRLYAN